LILRKKNFLNASLNIFVNKFMNKKIIVAAAALAAVFILTFVISKKRTAVEQSVPKEVLNVTTQSADASTKLAQVLEYPALTAGDQQITLSANAAGTITRINFDLGGKVFQGKQLAVIDEIGNNFEIGENGLKSAAVQALELEVESAEEKYKSAKRTYQDDKTYTNKKAKEVAEINLEIAETALNGALNNRLVISPISGTVTEKPVSQGDSVSVGQKIATISKTALTKVQFFVDKEDLSNFKIGTKISINEDGDVKEGIVIRISPQADPETKRFLIEASPSGKSPLLIGSVISVSLDVTRTPDTPGNLILPLSAITLSQNESHIFIIENGHAKKTAVSVEKVQGEYAEIKTDIAKDARIIIKGSKLVEDGEEVSA